MPEKPEVVTVAKSLENKLLGKKICCVNIFWDRIIAYPKSEEFIKQIKNEVIHSIRTRGKWLVFTLTNHTLLIHLRMEGKFFFRTKDVKREKHEHVIFTLDDGRELRYHDVRKFGKMYLLSKENVEKEIPLCDLGLEYDDKNLTSMYLLEKFRSKKIPIKTALLDQSIIAGLGNIYVDEVLFLSKLFPLKKACLCTERDCEKIIQYTKEVIGKAIQMGGTTIRSYTSEEGVHGRFQNELCIHGQKKCPLCQRDVVKIKIGGRGSYYCPVCQENHEDFP